jgi:hypothetical protein
MRKQSRWLSSSSACPSHALTAGAYPWPPAGPDAYRLRVIVARVS